MQRQTKAHVIEKEKKGHMEGIHLCRTGEGKSKPWLMYHRVSDSR